MVERRSFVLARPQEPAIHGVAHLPPHRARCPVVVQCHGFKGFMDWGFHPALADLLAGRGFLAIRFSFSLCGVHPGSDRVDDLEAFRCNTFSRELDDLQAVLDRLDEIAPGAADLDRVAIFGHSRGGGISVLAAARNQPFALVTWAAVSTFDRASEDEKAAWREQGEIVVRNARTEQDLPLGVGLLEDLEQRREELDIQAAATRRAAPWLLLHGTEDETVPFHEAELLARRAAAPCELAPVEGGSHTLGATHPFHGPTPHLIEAMNRTQEWLLRWSRSGA